MPRLTRLDDTNQTVIAGLEPATSALTRQHSSQLSYITLNIPTRNRTAGRGFGNLDVTTTPLRYKILDAGIEPTSRGYKTLVLPIELIQCITETTGFEPVEHT